MSQILHSPEHTKPGGMRLIAKDEGCRLTVCDGPKGLTERPGITVAEFNNLFSTAAPGDSLPYHRGFLALDRGIGTRVGDEAGQELDRVATALMELAEAGQIRLVQRRNGPNDYTYVAVRAHNHRRSAVRSAWEAAS